MTLSVLSTATGRARVLPIVKFGMLGMSAGENLLIDGDRWGANHTPAFAHADTAVAAA